jgi:hypothetical protein
MAAGTGAGDAAPVTIFRDRPRLLVLYAVLGLIFVVQGIATTGYFILFDDGAGFFTIGILLSLFLLLIGIFFAGYALIRLRDRHAPITVGPDGLHDRILSKRPIPWADIRDLRIYPAPRGGPVVVFDLAEGAEERAGVYKRARMAVGVNRPFGYSYQVHAMGTDAAIDPLVEAIRPYAAVRDG